jgi:hypothetical protein
MVDITSTFLAGSSAGSRMVFSNRPNVLIIRSKTVKFITPVAHKFEPEVVIVGAKQLKVINIPDGLNKWYYLLVG